MAPGRPEAYPDPAAENPDGTEDDPVGAEACPGHADGDSDAPGTGPTVTPSARQTVAP
jgi:hypothetical protein